MLPWIAYRRRRRWAALYKIVAPSGVEKVLLRTSTYDRIGPITLPLRTLGGQIIDFVLYYYGFYASGDSYLLITRAAGLRFYEPIVRISSNCNWAFDLDSVRCECDWEFQEAKARVAKEPNHDGLIIFAVDQHGKSIPGGMRGHALIYALGQAQQQDLVYDAYIKNGFALDYRQYDDVCVILHSVGIRKMRLLTNNPERIQFFRGRGFKATREPIEKPYEKHDSEELGVKKERLHHLLSLNGFKPDDIKIYGLDPDAIFGLHERENRDTRDQ
jgi:GTP cyclohydrolase II